VIFSGSFGWMGYGNVAAYIDNNQPKSADGCLSLKFPLVDVQTWSDSNSAWGFTNCFDMAANQGIYTSGLK
jgi:hypothetical protein